MGAAQILANALERRLSLRESSAGKHLSSLNLSRGPRYFRGAKGDAAALAGMLQ